MAKICKNISELKTEILKYVQEGLETKVFETVQDEEVEKIQEVVYKVYKPREYTRRYSDDGLSDKDNIKKNILNDDDEVTLFVTNQTKGNPDYLHGINADKYIAMIVETGDGGGYGNYDFGSHKDAAYLKPRRFQQATIDSLANNKRHVVALKEYLERQGFKVK